MKRQVFPFVFPVETVQILRYRSQVLKELCEADAGFAGIPVSSMSTETLEHLLEQYDTLFFSGFLKDRLSCLHVTLSSRMTSSAGKFICVRGPFRRIRQAEIRMSSDFLFRLEEGPFELNGLSADTPQEAFLLVFEHELCHALETIVYGETGHGDRFLSLANGLFGHTATRHRLPTRKQTAADSGIMIGSCVSFSYQGNTLFGRITYIGKTATVMVHSPQGNYRDRSGKRYMKYRVPLSRLTVVSV